MKPTKRQLRAYYLVNVVGESMAKAGIIMGGISRQAVKKLLDRFEQNRKRAKGNYKFMI